MKMKKILIINNENISVRNHRMTFIKYLQQQNYEVVVASAVIDDDIETISMECRFITLKKLNLHSTNPLKDVMFFIELIRLYRFEKPNLICHFTAKPNIYGSMAAYILNIPAISTVNGLGRVFDKENITSFIVSKLYKYSISFCNLVFFQNHDDRDLFIKKRIIPEELGEVVHGSGVDTEKISPLNYIPTKKNDSFVFIFASRLIWSKGVKEFILAAEKVKQKYPNSEFRIYGYIAEHEKNAVTKDYLNTYQAQGVIKFFGSTNKLLEEMALSDVVVLPSYYREGIPKVLIEALALGKPIITTNSVGCRETVEYGKNGFTVPIKDFEELAKSMVKIMSLPNADYKEMCKYSRNMALEGFDKKKIFLRYLEVIESTIL
jgi:glycosyltransferase involved in cell wall biosynthesis